MIRRPLARAVRRAIAAWPLAALGLLFAAAPPTASTAPAVVVGLESGLRISIDPETGDLLGMPRADALTRDASLRESLSRSSAGLVPRVRPDGSVSVYLQGRFMSASVARIGADGEVQTLCTDEFDQAHAFLEGHEGCGHPPVEWEVQ